MNQLRNTVLVIEDDQSIRKLYGLTLDSDEFRVIDCENGRSGIRSVASVKPDLVLLDLGLPDMNGKDVLRAIREWSQVPIIVCSARDEDSEILEAFESGADDYVIKPFSPDILVARIMANLRKSVTVEAGEPELVNGALRIDLVRHEVFLGDDKISLTPKEFALLRYLLINRGKMLTHQQILSEIWGPAHINNNQYLRVYVGHLRDKLSSDIPGAPHIMTEVGIGYRMEVAAA